VKKKEFLVFWGALMNVLHKVSKKVGEKSSPSLLPDPKLAYFEVLEGTGSFVSAALRSK
jgi:hypothetical protein